MVWLSQARLAYLQPALSCTQSELGHEMHTYMNWRLCCASKQGQCMSCRAAAAMVHCLGVLCFYAQLGYGQWQRQTDLCETELSQQKLSKHWQQYGVLAQGEGHLLFKGGLLEQAGNGTSSNANTNGCNEGKSNINRISYSAAAVAVVV